MKKGWFAPFFSVFYPRPVGMAEWKVVGEERGREGSAALSCGCCEKWRSREERKWKGDVVRFG